MPETDILAATADAYFRRSAKLHLCPECLGGMKVGDAYIAEHMVSELAFGLAGGTVEVTRGTLDATDFGERAVSNSFQFVARHPIFSTAPTRIIYGTPSGDALALRLFNWKVRLLPEFQGQGIATIGFALQVRAARQIGCDQIKAGVAGNPTHPTLFGYSYWPHAGFRGRIPHEIWWSLPAGELTRTGLNLGRGPIDIGDLVNHPGGAELWRRHGTGFQMSFDLSDANPYVMDAEATLEELGL